MKEKWVELSPSTDKGRYEISNTGKVRALRMKTTRGGAATLDVPFVKKTSKDGRYTCINSWKDNKIFNINIGREVAKAFLPNPENKPCVFHIDGNIHNNSITNLMWCTYKEIGALKHDRKVAKGWESVKTKRKKVRETFREKYNVTGGVSSKPVLKCDENGNVLETFPSVREAAKACGISRQAMIARCQRGFKTGLRGKRFQKGDGAYYTYAEKPWK